jgi:hypothetical protein
MLVCRILGVYWVGSAGAWWCRMGGLARARLRVVCTFPMGAASRRVTDGRAHEHDVL